MITLLPEGTISYCHFSDLKNFANSRPPASSFFQSLEHFFLTIGQNNFGNKIPFSDIAMEISENQYAQTLFMSQFRSNFLVDSLKYVEKKIKF